MGIIKVAIADDHKIFRKGVILSLRPYSAIKFVQEAENGQELLDGLAASEPDVVLMDLRMPQEDGIETTKIIAKQYPSIHIIALTMSEYGDHVKRPGAGSGAIYLHGIHRPGDRPEDRCESPDLRGHQRSAHGTIW